MYFVPFLKRPQQVTCIKSEHTLADTIQIIPSKKYEGVIFQLAIRLIQEAVEGIFQEFMQLHHNVGKESYLYRLFGTELIL